MRIDKWLWCVRIYKTRTLAAEACNLGKVTCNSQTMKPSKEVQIGSEVEIRLNPLNKKVRVLALLNNRVAAKEVSKYYEDLTSEEEYEKVRMIGMMYYERRDGHIGRPTKRDRRDIEKFKDSEY